MRVHHSSLDSPVYSCICFNFPTIKSCPKEEAKKWKKEKKEKKLFISVFQPKDTWASPPPHKPHAVSGIRIPTPTPARQAPGVRKGKSLARGLHPTWIPIPALPLTSCGALGKRVSFLELQFPHKKTDKNYLLLRPEQGNLARFEQSTHAVAQLSLALKRPLVSLSEASFRGERLHSRKVLELCSHSRKAQVLLFDPEGSTGLQLALAYPCHLPPQNNSSVDPGRTPVYLNLLETSYPEDPCLLPKGLKCQSYLSLVSKSHFSSLDKKPSLSHIIKLQSLVKGETSPDFSR